MAIDGDRWTLCVELTEQLPPLAVRAIAVVAASVMTEDV